MTRLLPFDRLLIERAGESGAAILGLVGDCVRSEPIAIGTTVASALTADFAIQRDRSQFAG